ncbi:ABC transporter ATP-binding protein [Asanoa sp. NPDC050611]|uniref:ABC transporter ATP-binding protein n=1 Tax=Asanoa sp. NPDC050611 TaxID=3157098 RepID=UPI0033D382DB
MTEEPVVAEGLGRRYGERLWALRDVSLAVPAGRFVAVMGATGSGKSTLLHCLAGLDRPTAGRVRLAGRDITRLREAALTRLRRDRVGFVFQSYNLLSTLTVAGNVLLPTRLGGPRVSGGDLEAVLGAVGLDGLGGRPVGELSGGQRQRVAVARALVTEPALLLADEPTGNLDSRATEDVLAIFDELSAAGRTIVVITHEVEVGNRASRLVRLRDGAVVADDRQDARVPA